MAKKRTTLDAVLPNMRIPLSETRDQAKPLPPEKEQGSLQEDFDRPQIKQQTLYLKLPLHRQLRILAFEEEKKMHDLWLEALDLLFANRGLPSSAELTDE